MLGGGFNMHIVPRTLSLGWAQAASSAALGLALIAAPAVCRADSAPAVAAAPAAPAAPAAAAAAPGPSTAPVAPPPAHPIGHLPVLDVSPVFTQPLTYSNSGQLKGYQPLDFNVTARVPITSKFSLIFDRVIGGTLDVPLQAQVVPGVGAVYPGVTRDIVLFYHGVYTPTKYLTIDAGDAFRHRAYNAGDVSGANGVSGAPYPASYSSTEAHWAYLGATYTTHPIKELLNTSIFFTEQGEESNVDHHVGLVCSPGPNIGIGTCTPAIAFAGPPYPDLSIDENPHQNKYYTSQQTLGLTIPLDAKRTAILSIQDGWGALSWYENAEFPYTYSGIEQALLSKRFNSVFTLSLRAREYFQHPQGAPFPAPDIIHLGSVDVIGTFHVDTNSLFH
jgi:hypothetical protein